jgi:diacylglycerol kinase family enzyme
LRQSGVYHRRVRRIEVEASETVPVQLDGDPAGAVEPGQPWTVTVEPGAVEVLVPGAKGEAREPGPGPSTRNLVPQDG